MVLSELLFVLDEDPHLGIDQITPDPISDLLVGKLCTGIAAAKPPPALLRRWCPDEPRVDFNGRAGVYFFNSLSY